MSTHLHPQPRESEVPTEKYTTADTSASTPDPNGESARFFAALLGGGLPDGLYAHVWHITPSKHPDWVRDVAEAEASAGRNGRHDVYVGAGLAPKASAGERVRIETAQGVLGLLVVSPVGSWRNASCRKRGQRGGAPCGRQRRWS